MVKFSNDCLLNQTESCSSCSLAGSHQLWRVTFSIFVTCFNSLFNGFLFSLLLLRGWGLVWG